MKIMRSIKMSCILLKKFLYLWNQMLRPLSRLMLVMQTIMECSLFLLNSSRVRCRCSRCRSGNSRKPASRAGPLTLHLRVSVSFVTLSLSLNLWNPIVAMRCGARKLLVFLMELVPRVGQYASSTSPVQNSVATPGQGRRRIGDNYTTIFANNWHKDACSQKEGANPLSHLPFQILSYTIAFSSLFGVYVSFQTRYALVPKFVSSTCLRLFYCFLLSPSNLLLFADSPSNCIFYRSLFLLANM